SVIPGSRAYYDRMFQHVTLLESRPMALGASPIKMKGNANEMVLSRAMDGAQVESDEEPKASDGGQEAKSEEPRGEEQVRENLSETAFFLPGLTTDGAGNVAIRFTLPESVTTWRMMGLAHDRDVNYGMIEGETVAQKTVMVQPNVPRFLRSGDKATIATRIINTSEKAVSGTATLTLIDAETEKRVYTQQRPYSIAAGQTTGVSFDYTPAMANAMLVCRITAEGKDYSDGEQHYLPILPDREWVTNTRPFTQNGAGTLNIDLQELFPAKSTDRKLTVEYTNNPTWLMVQALPSIATCDDHNAISLATAYYANAIANHILQQSPTIKEVVKLWKRETGSETSLMSSLEKNQELKTLVLSETPWVMDADREADQKQSLINYFDEIQVGYRQSTYLDKLKKLQNPDGSFSWWPDMPGSRYMTTSVCETLTRLAQMTGEQRDTQRIIADALDYMEREAHEEVKYLRKLEKKEKHLRPSEMAIDYMYVRALRGDELRGRAAEDVEYLVKLFEKKTTVFSIYGKARAAIILAWSKRTGKAQEYLESIRQHTVYKEEMGRYFDTWKALYSWRDYRIPSQVAAIEALKRLAPTDRKTITEMQRWLLQEKRTQAWDTPINSVDA
ncbi:MAG: hypothetical protein II128_01745, partial [Atopobiaceae bacterium]|nr:hypothetical protein [Atopobiaceae bacterium]